MARKKKKIIDNFERSSFDYFNDIKKYSPLVKDDELSLWEKYKKNNDIKARDMIINSNLKFVASVAKDYIGLGLPYSDLIAEGNLGLLKAIDNFDYQRGFKTISYSVWWIRQTIMEALKKRNSIKGDELIEEQKNDIDCDFEDEYNINEQDNNYDEYEDFDSFKNSEEIKIISMLFDGLSQREIFILKNYFGLDGYEELTLEKIGEELNLTKERVRQIKECALKKLRSAALEKSITSEIYR